MCIYDTPSPHNCEYLCIVTGNHSLSTNRQGYRSGFYGN